MDELLIIFEIYELHSQNEFRSVPFKITTTKLLRTIDCINCTTIKFDGMSFLKRKHQLHWRCARHTKIISHIFSKGKAITGVQI